MEFQFRETLCARIQQEYPTYADMSPVILNRLIGFALLRARQYGLIWQSSLAQFVYLMAAIAPNFDLHPAVHAVLANSAIAPEKRIPSLTQRLPAGVWMDATTNTSTIGWFLTQDSFKLNRQERISHALTNMLSSKTQTNSTLVNDQVDQALKQAAKLGFLLEDSQFVYSAACLEYGADFALQAEWAKETFSPKYTPVMQLALLRVRLALDAGLWI